MLLTYKIQRTYNLANQLTKFNWKADADIKSKVAYIDTLILTLNIQNSRLIANCFYIKLNKTKNCESELRKQKKVESKKDKFEQN